MFRVCLTSAHSSQAPTHPTSSSPQPGNTKHHVSLQPPYTGPSLISSLPFPFHSSSSFPILGIHFYSPFGMRGEECDCNNRSLLKKIFRLMSFKIFCICLWFIIRSKPVFDRLHIAYLMATAALTCDDSPRLPIDITLYRSKVQEIQCSSIMCISVLTTGIERLGKHCPSLRYGHSHPWVV